MGQGTARTSGSIVTMTNAKSVHAEKVNIYRSLTIVMGSYVRGAYDLRAVDWHGMLVLSRMSDDMVAWWCGLRPWE